MHHGTELVIAEHAVAVRVGGKKQLLQLMASVRVLLLPDIQDADQEAVEIDSAPPHRQYMTRATRGYAYRSEREACRDVITRAM